MDESRHKSRPNPSKGMALEVYKYKDPKHTKGPKNPTFKRTSTPKLYSKNSQPKLKLSFDQKPKHSLKVSTSTYADSFKTLVQAQNL
ncbi:hypothetical protein COP2_019456 [Malus domestica]